MNDGPVLAVDLGGTKLLVALVDGARVIDRSAIATDRLAGPADWVRKIAELARPWDGRFSRAGVAVTGRVHEGLWSALNSSILDVSSNFPLAHACEKLLGVPITLRNDAQAAAWGEYRYGAGLGRDLVFLTISTGIGGGIVANGRLLSGRGGLAGHVGQFLPPEVDPDTDALLEDQVSGRWIADEAARCKHDVDARRVFEDAEAGEPWAQRIIDVSAQRTARLCRNIQLLVDPEVIIVGGGIGLAKGYLDRIFRALADLPAEMRPTLLPAALGQESGIVGIAALSAESQLQP